MNPITGRCLCGQITFQFESFAGGVAHCHCSMCRRFSGSAFATFGTVDQSDFQWLSGKDLLKVYPSSEQAERGFCSHCGSSLFYRLRGKGSSIEIALGALDGNPDVNIDAHIYCKNRPDWAEADPELTYDEGRT